jgi:hypothetical protein
MIRDGDVIDAATLAALTLLHLAGSRLWAFGLTRTPLSPNDVPAVSIGGDFNVVGGAARRGYARFNLP